MKRTLKSMIGATLLEVMLVLAIAAMIIVMSIRYYQTAQTNQQANAFVSQIQAIVAASDSMATATGSFLTGGVTTASLTTMLPAGGMMTPWGSPITVAATANLITITTTAAPANVCTLALPKIKANSKFAGTTATTCASIVYNSNL